MSIDEQTKKRFWAKVRKTGTCWLWIGSIDRQGYGRFFLDYYTATASRVVYQMEIGPIPSGLHVCHHCDNPACVNPAHLFLGTRSDNIRDCIRKGRNVHQPRGERHYRSKLTDVQVAAIRADTRTHKAIAVEHGVKRAVIGKIKLRQTWRHVP